MILIRDSLYIVLYKCVGKYVCVCVCVYVPAHRADIGAGSRNMTRQPWEAAAAGDDDDDDDDDDDGDDVVST